MKEKKHLKEETSKGALGHPAKTHGHTEGSSGINELSEIGRYDLKRKRTG